MTFICVDQSFVALYEKVMDVQFENDQLATIETESAAQTELPVTVIQVARKKLAIIRAAPNVATIKNWKSLGLVVLSEESRKYIIQLTLSWFIFLEVKMVNDALTACVVALSQDLKGVA